MVRTPDVRQAEVDQLHQAAMPDILTAAQQLVAEGVLANAELSEPERLALAGIVARTDETYDSPETHEVRWDIMCAPVYAREGKKVNPRHLALNSLRKRVFEMHDAAGGNSLVV